tara:strand:+ start:7597 stop:7857 length:261 start_codon:yes stop_codon:yes gene_type:complete
MKKVKVFNQAQQSFVKRMYLQLNDSELAKSMGLSINDIRAFRVRQNLLRGEYTKRKLGIIKSKILPVKLDENIESETNKNDEQQKV